MVNKTEILRDLKAMADPEILDSIVRFGISAEGRLGIAIPALRDLAKEIGKNHQLAEELWSSGIADARLLASMIDDPAEVTPAQMDRWAEAFDSWDLCDQCCNNLFRKTPFAFDKAAEWSARAEEYVKRAGFVLMAALAVHERRADDARFLRFLPLIERESGDDRRYVGKAINWALRQIGKRNVALNAAAIGCARGLSRLNARGPRRIASGALRELTSAAIRARLRR